MNRRDDRPLCGGELEPGEVFGEWGLERPRRLHVALNIAGVFEDLASASLLVQYLKAAERAAYYGLQESPLNGILRDSHVNALAGVGLLSPSGVLQQGNVLGSGLRLIWMPPGRRPTPRDYKDRGRVESGDQIRKRRPIPLSVRFATFKRAAFRCVFCGASADDGATLHIDHIIPVSRGGSNDPGNLQTACDECNIGRSDSGVQP